MNNPSPQISKMSPEYFRNFSSPYSLNQSSDPPQKPVYQSNQQYFNPIQQSPLQFQQSKISYPSLPSTYDPNPNNFSSLDHRKMLSEININPRFSPHNSLKFLHQDASLPSNGSYLERSNFQSNLNFSRIPSPNPNERKPPSPFQERHMNFPENIETPSNMLTMNRSPLNPSFNMEYNKPPPGQIYNPSSIYKPPLMPPIDKYENPNRFNRFASPESYISSTISDLRPPENFIHRPTPTPEYLMSSNEPPAKFRNLNESLMNLTPIYNVMNQPAPPMFYSNKLNDQSKENHVFPDFITAFGTYKHYDLASKESKFRKIPKKNMTSNIENNFIEDMSYLNVNFLSQSYYDKIFDVLKNFIFFDRSVEKLKEDLAHRSDFDIKLLFQFFDDNNTNQIVVSEWKEGLVKLGIIAEETDIYLMVNRYNRDGNKKIGFEEFCEIILPNNGMNKEYILKKESRQKFLSNESQHLTAKLFKMILNICYSSELIRKEIEAENINLTEVFNFMDHSKGGLITKEELKMFLNKYDFHPFNEDLDNLMNRFDRNHSGKVNFKEFEYELLPKLLEN